MSRQRYDEAGDLWGSDGGLSEPRDGPAGAGLPDSDAATDYPGAGVLHGLGASNLWLATFVQLTEHPMPVEGLVVDQSPRSPAKIHRRDGLTVQVWHPPARSG